MATFHILDRTSGLFYAGTQRRDEVSDIFGVRSGYRVADAPRKECWVGVTDLCIVAYAKRGFGRAFKDMGKLKTHLNMLLGILMPPEEYQHRNYWRLPHNTPLYNETKDRIEAWHRLHPGYENVPDFMHNDHPIPFIPDSWEVVEVVDRKAKRFHRVDFDAPAFGRDAQRLRRLTDTYGSAVKAVYRKIEKKGAIADYPFVVAVSPDFDHLMQDRSVWELPDHQPDAKKIDEAIIQSVGNKREVIRASAEWSTAVAFKNVSGAIMFKMAYDVGNHVVTVLDIRTLEEVATAPVEHAMKDAAA